MSSWSLVTTSACSRAAVSATTASTTSLTPTRPSKWPAACAASPVSAVTSQPRRATRRRPGPLNARGLQAAQVTLLPAEPVQGTVNLGYARIGVLRDDPAC